MTPQTLKPGWKMVKFGDMAQNVTVRIDPAEAETDVYVGLEHLDPSTLHLSKWGHPSDVTGQKFAFKKGDVIFGRRRAYQRKLAVAEFDGICSAHAMVVRAKPKLTLPEFLPFFLQSDMFMDRAIEISVGSLSPTINWTALKVLEFPLPPLDEQERIAKILCAADEAVCRYDRLSTDAKSVLVVTASELCWDISLPEMPILEIVKGTTDKFIDGDWIESKDQAKSGIKLLQMADIGDGEFLDKSDRYIDEPTFVRLKCTEVLPGDILVSRMADPIGRACIAPNIDQRMITAVDCTIVRVNEILQIRKYWSYLMQTGKWKRAVESRAGGSTRLRISRKNMESIKVPMPSKHRQEEVVHILDELNNAFAKTVSTSDDARNLYIAIREKLLRPNRRGADFVQ